MTRYDYVHTSAGVQYVSPDTAHDFGMDLDDDEHALTSDGVAVYGTPAGLLGWLDAARTALLAAHPDLAPVAPTTAGAGYLTELVEVDGGDNVPDGVDPVALLGWLRASVTVDEQDVALLVDSIRANYPATNGREGFLSDPGGWLAHLDLTSDHIVARAATERIAAETVPA